MAFEGEGDLRGHGRTGVEKGRRVVGSADRRIDQRTDMMDQDQDVAVDTPHTEPATHTVLTRLRERNAALVAALRREHNLSSGHDFIKARNCRACALLARAF
ncbi:MAG: hypothetical protein B7Z14_15275 [Bosea sp. 32-68-6]|nr:MAG: hypothetical protein B7Z14_15275 [Bosea sp. 32-68-6]